MELAANSEGNDVAAARPRSQAPTVYVVGFWRRLAAMVIDMALVAPVAAVVIFIASRATGIGLPTARLGNLDFLLDILLGSDPAFAMTAGLYLAALVTYLFIMQLTLGQTYGMRVLGMRVIDQYGGPPDVTRCIRRALGYLLGFGTLGLGFLWSGFDSEKRGLHDYLAGTLVIATKPPGRRSES
ncbi:MAG: RDD family protein [Myxococcales bacterium]|nr:RDD family protein [Myxococcales bacterium]